MRILCTHRNQIIIVDCLQIIYCFDTHFIALAQKKTLKEPVINNLPGKGIIFIVSRQNLPDPPKTLSNILMFPSNRQQLIRSKCCIFSPLYSVGDD